MDALRADFVAWAFLFGLFWFLMGAFVMALLIHRERQTRRDSDSFVPTNRREFAGRRAR